MCCLNSKLLTFLLSLFLIFTVSAYAADENEVKSLDELVIEAPMAELRDTFNDFMPIPTSKIKVDRSEIDTINTISIEDTVRYIPNTEVRRRYIGDANGVIAMRGNGNFQTARHMLFVDGFPLHSFLRTRFNGAPQWNFVSPDETDHVEIFLLDNPKEKNGHCKQQAGFKIGKFLKVMGLLQVIRPFFPMETNMTTFLITCFITG
jgi:hypothetical protein